MSPIIVYPMGKLGSQSVYRSLLKFFEEKHMYVSIYNIHVLHDLEYLDEIKE